MFLRLAYGGLKEAVSSKDGQIKNAWSCSR